VLDGAVAIYDEKLRSRFDWLREPDPHAVATPPMFMVFDLLHQDRLELTGRPLRERRARLENAPVAEGQAEELDGRRGSLAADQRGSVGPLTMDDDFISDDDLKTFDGWLRYQGMSASSAEELAELRRFSMT